MGGVSCPDFLFIFIFRFILKKNLIGRIIFHFSKLLRMRNCASTWVSTFVDDCLSWFETREFAYRPWRASEDHRFRFCKKIKGQNMDAVRYTRIFGYVVNGAVKCKASTCIMFEFLSLSFAIAAPEIIQSKGHNRAVDWWALGKSIGTFLYPIEISRSGTSGQMCVYSAFTILQNPVRSTADMSKYTNSKCVHSAVSALHNA